MAYDPRARKLYELRAHRNGGRVRVDAAPIRAHIQRLAQTASLSTIAKAAGLRQSTVSRIAAGKYASTSPTIAHALLAVTGTIGAGTGYVAALGTMRRLQALRALGWPIEDLAPHVGITPQGISWITSGHNAHVRAVVRDAVADAFQRLAMSLPEPTNAYERAGYDRARRHAERMGWAPPLAWDDIDDPNATPSLGEQTKRSTGGTGTPVEVLVENIEWLLQFDPTLTATQLAARLGYADRSGIQNALGRNGYLELRDRLNRNAELAGANVTARAS